MPNASAIDLAVMCQQYEILNAIIDYGLGNALVLILFMVIIDDYMKFFQIM